MSLTIERVHGGWLLEDDRAKRIATSVDGVLEAVRGWMRTHAVCSADVVSGADPSAFFPLPLLTRDQDIPDQHGASYTGDPP